MRTVLNRSLVILWGYLLAILAGVAGPIFVGGILFYLSAGGEQLGGAIRMGFVTTGWLAVPIALICAIPAGILIIIAEHYRIRSQSFYVLAAISACLLLAISSALLADTWEQTLIWLTYAVPSFGIAGLILGPIVGSVYWHVAGRNAGEACGNRGVDSSPDGSSRQQSHYSPGSPGNS